MRELEQLAELIESGSSKRILVLCGAGVSTGAGIPDFRSPGTGLYDNLQKYSLPYPEAIFEINYYRRSPEAFVSLANELWPGIKFKPTLTHHFLKLLADKGLLLRIYTQNIDGLEFLAGIPDEKLVECHGHFRTASCIDCGRPANAEEVKETIVLYGKTPKCNSCGGNVKPDVVFFGEGLPNRFHRLLKQDLPKADLLLVMGTSLQVAPVSMIPNMVRCKRVLFNRDLVMKIKKDRDMFIPGNCDANVQKLIDLLDWKIEPKTTSTDDDEQKEESSKNNDEESLEKLFAKIEVKDAEKQSDQSDEKKEKGKDK
jgi:NAD-dependent SIR2 family protein deacetylase